MQVLLRNFVGNFVNNFLFIFFDVDSGFLVLQTISKSALVVL